MIRIFKYDKPDEYRDFENYVFTNLDKSLVDIPNDKVTLDAVDYRISTAIDTENEESSSPSQPVSIDTDFDTFIEQLYFRELVTGTIYKFFYDLFGQGADDVEFTAVSPESGFGSHGSQISMTVFGNVLLEYRNEVFEEVVEEIGIVLNGSGDSLDDIVFNSDGSEESPIVIIN